MRVDTMDTFTDDLLERLVVIPLATGALWLLKVTGLNPFAGFGEFEGSR